MSFLLDKDCIRRRYVCFCCLLFLLSRFIIENTWSVHFDIVSIRLLRSSLTTLSIPARLCDALRHHASSQKPSRLLYLVQFVLLSDKFVYSNLERLGMKFVLISTSPSARGLYQIRS